jgi:hypothetical protein
VNIGMNFRQAYGLSIRDEMNLVPTFGQLDSELGGYDAASPVSRIAGDSYLHPPVLSRKPFRLSDSMVSAAPRFRFWIQEAGEKGRVNNQD